ncbi:MAG: hypothetical protein MHM6MM_003638 [Cercozoa sp. M6MM]
MPEDTQPERHHETKSERPVHFEPKRKIMIAVDASEHAERAVHWAIENHLREGDLVVLVTAVDIDVASSWAGLGAAAVYDALQEVRTRAVEEAKVLIHKYTALLKENHLHYLATVVSGDPRDAIMFEVDKHKVDTLILGTRGRGVVARTLLGSVSDHILHHVQVPVIVVRQ